MSKKIYLKRRKPFIHEHMNSEIMEEQMSYTKRSLASFFESKTSTNSGSGLNPIEKKLLMPIVLGIDIGPDFFKKVNDYYVEIDTKIPAGKKGLELEIGLLNDEKKLGERLYPESSTDLSINLPLNIDDYLRYRHALAHPLCAASPEQAEGHSLHVIWCYLEDPGVVMKNKLGDIEVQDRAMISYQQIKGDISRVKMVVSLMKNMIPKKAGFPIPNVDTMNSDELLIALRELATVQPSRFYEYANDQSLKKRYFIDRLLSTGILVRIGNAIVDNETNNSLGDSIKEVLGYLWDGKNSGRLTYYKQKLEESGKTVLIEE